MGRWLDGVIGSVSFPQLVRHSFRHYTKMDSRELTQIGASEGVDVGSHIIHLFDGRSDSPVEAAAQFAQAGFAEGDSVVMVLPDSWLRGVESLIPDSADLTHSGRLLLISPGTVYIEDDHFSSSRAMDTWKRIYDEKKTGGIRLFGMADERATAERIPVTKFMEYEAHVNHSHNYKSIVCTYDENSLAPDMLDMAIANHQLVWQGSAVYRNPDYLTPEHFLEDFYARDVREFTWPAEPRHCRSARMAVGEIAARMPFSLKEIDEIQLAVGEAFANAVRHGSPYGSENRVSIRVTPTDESLTVDVTDQGDGITHEPKRIDWREPGGKGLYLMRTFCDKVEHFNDGCGCTVRMVKYTPERRC